MVKGVTSSTSDTLPETGAKQKAGQTTFPWTSLWLTCWVEGDTCFEGRFPLHLVTPVWNQPPAQM